MEPEERRERWGRALVVLAGLLFAGLPVWLGLALRHRSGPATGTQPTFRAAPPVASTRSLYMTMPPRMETGPAGRLYVAWRTSLPADSFVTFGRADAVERVAAKDSALVTDHRFALPAEPFVGFCRLHVMSVSEEGESVSADLGPGGGRAAAFQPAAEQFFAELGPADAYSWADWDADGRVEAATWGDGTGVAVLGPRGREWAPAAGSGQGAPSCVALYWADMNADGLPDLVSVGAAVSIWLNAGGELATPPVAWREGDLGTLAASVCDLDADGSPDVAVLAGDGSLHLLHSAPAEPALAAESLLELPAVATPAAPPVLVVADFTGDHKVDILTRAGRLALLAGTDEDYEEVAGSLPEAAASPGPDAWIEPADWDGDGDLDLLLAEKGGKGRLVLLANDGWGRFAETAGTGELPHDGLPARCGAWADLDGNGLSDLVLATERRGLRVYLNAGEAGFMDATALCRLPLPPELEVRSLSAPDIDGDGAPDIVVGTAARAFVLLNGWHPPSAEAFLRVVPEGAFGLSGCVATILDGQGEPCSSRRFPIRGNGRATGPAEFCFGVAGLDRCTVRVAFSQGESIISAWQRGKGMDALAISSSGPGTAAAAGRP